MKALKNNSTLFTIIGILLALSVVGWVTMGQKPFVRTTLSGLQTTALVLPAACSLLPAPASQHH